MTWQPMTVRPSRLSVTATLVAWDWDRGRRRRGASARARSAMASATSDLSSWKRFGLPASGGGYAADARSERVELLGDGLRVQG